MKQDNNPKKIIIGKVIAKTGKHCAVVEEIVTGQIYLCDAIMNLIRQSELGTPWCLWEVENGDH